MSETNLWTMNDVTMLIKPALRGPCPPRLLSSTPLKFPVRSPTALKAPAAMMAVIAPLMAKPISPLATPATKEPAAAHNGPPVPDVMK
jgi:hypothetical protein